MSKDNRMNKGKRKTKGELIVGRNVREQKKEKKE